MGHKGDLEVDYGLRKQLPKDIIEQMRRGYQAALKYLETQASIQLEDPALGLVALLLKAWGHSDEEVGAMNLATKSQDDLVDLLQGHVPTKPVAAVPSNQRLVTLGELIDATVKEYEPAMAELEPDDTFERIKAQVDAASGERAKWYEQARSWCVSLHRMKQTEEALNDYAKSDHFKPGLADDKRMRCPEAEVMLLADVANSEPDEACRFLAGSMRRLRQSVQSLLNHSTEPEVLGTMLADLWRKNRTDPFRSSAVQNVPGNAARLEFLQGMGRVVNQAGELLPSFTRLDQQGFDAFASATWLKVLDQPCEYLDAIQAVTPSPGTPSRPSKSAPAAARGTPSASVQPAPPAKSLFADLAKFPAGSRPRHPRSSNRIQPFSWLAPLTA